MAYRAVSLRQHVGFLDIFSELINETLKIHWLFEILDIKCNGGGVEKIWRRRDWTVVNFDDFDAMEIRRGHAAHAVLIR